MRFDRLASGKPADLVVQKLREREPCTPQELLQEVHLPTQTAQEALDGLLESGDVRNLQDGSLLSTDGWEWYTTRMTDLLANYHTSYPLRLGMPREELGSRLRLESRVYAGFLDAVREAGLIEEAEGNIRLPSHSVTLTEKQQKRVDALLTRFQSDPYTPPNPNEAVEIVGEELLDLLVAQGDLVRVSQEVLLLPEVYEEMVAAVRRLIEEQGSITVAELRDHFDTSRKYAIALLEYLDDMRVTRRIGDKRVLR